MKSASKSAQNCNFVNHSRPTPQNKRFHPTTKRLFLAASICLFWSVDPLRTTPIIISVHLDEFPAPPTIKKQRGQMGLAVDIYSR